METEFLTRDLVAHEIRRWLAMHEVARTVFDGLPPEQQDTIRRDGQPITVPLSALVGCKPEVRELAVTILQEVLVSCESSVSYPLATVGAKTETRRVEKMGSEEMEERAAHLENRMGRLEALTQDLLDVERGLLELLQELVPSGRAARRAGRTAPRSEG